MHTCACLLAMYLLRAELILTLCACIRGLRGGNAAGGTRVGLPGKGKWRTSSKAASVGAGMGG